MTERRSIRALVNVGTGEISREIFASDDLYQKEREQIFRKAWLYVGHISQVKKPGDFILSRMGEESVIVARDRTGRINVFLNSCRHRGMRVCRYDEGHTDSFFCPFHGWSYHLDGRLKSVTDHKKAYQREPFDWGEWGLVKVGRLADLRGTIWATWDPDAPDLSTFLGGAQHMLDIAFRAWDGEGEIELLDGTQKWIIPSNWKAVSENFIGDTLHGVSHRSVDIVGIGPNNAAGRRDENSSRLVQGCYAEGHGGIFHVFDADDPRPEYAACRITAEYFQHCLEKRRKLMGDQARVTASVGTIFPNMSFHSNQPRTILVAQPLSTDRTEMWRTYFVDKDAPPEVRAFLRSYYLRYSGPAGMTEQDDMENWNYATSSSRGATARRFPFNYKAGIGYDGTSELMPDAVIAHTPSVTGSTESPARAFYDRWATYMDAN